MDVSLSKWKEVENPVWRERASSAPGPNGTPYRLYRKCSRCSWKLGAELVPTDTKRGGILKHQPILTHQSPQCKRQDLLQHHSWEADKLSGKEQAAVCIGPKCWNSRVLTMLRWWSGTKYNQPRVTREIYMSSSLNSLMHLGQYHIVSSGLLSTSSKYKSPSEIWLSLFEDLHFCFTTPDFTTIWQHLELGVMAGRTISPLAFTMAMEVIIRASNWLVAGELQRSGFRLIPISNFMDDMTTLTTTAPCTRRLLRKLQENITWARWVLIHQNQITGSTIIENPFQGCLRNL